VIAHKIELSSMALQALRAELCDQYKGLADGLPLPRLQAGFDRITKLQPNANSQAFLGHVFKLMDGNGRGSARYRDVWGLFEDILTSCTQLSLNLLALEKQCVNSCQDITETALQRRQMELWTIQRTTREKAQRAAKTLFPNGINVNLSLPQWYAGIQASFPEPLLSLARLYAGVAALAGNAFSTTRFTYQPEAEVEPPPPPKPLISSPHKSLERARSTSPGLEERREAARTDSQARDFPSLTSSRVLPIVRTELAVH